MVGVIEDTFVHDGKEYTVVLRDDRKGGVICDGRMVLMNANSEDVFKYLEEIGVSMP